MVHPEKSICLRPVGRVRAAQGSFSIDIDPEFRPALKHLDQFSHIHVFWWAHKQDTPAARRMIQTELPYAPGITAGVFACRSECRPNPVAMTTCPLLSINEETGCIQVAWIDAFDNSPVLDIKPYLPVSDRIRDVKTSEWFEKWPQWMEDAAEFFMGEGSGLLEKME